MAKHYRPTKPTDPRVFTAQLVRRTGVSPNLVRVTLGGPGLEHFTPLGYDQWFRMFLPREGQDQLRLPSRTSGLWYAQYLATPKAARPLVRNYTVRAFRAAGKGGGAELDIDFVLHDEHAGPAGTWAAEAPIGSEVGILDQGLSFDPANGAEHIVIVADESGLPAALGVLASLPRDARVEAFIEIPGDEDDQPIELGAHMRVHWLPRADAHAKPGELALETLRKATLPSGRGYAFVVGEQSLPVGARRHLVGEAGWDKADVTFVGYWRQGAAYMG